MAETKYTIDIEFSLCQQHFILATNPYRTDYRSDLYLILIRHCLPPDRLSDYAAGAPAAAPPS